MSCMYLRICAWIFIAVFTNAVVGGPWASPTLELLDEINDAEIYRAVVSSMTEWQRKQNLKKTNGRQKRQESQVCYPDHGCFDTSGPFGYLDMPPSKPEEIATKFLLYPSHTRRRSGSSTAEVPYNKLHEAYSWSKDGFNSSLPTKVLIHGFGSDCSHIWIYEMRSALMAVEEVNVICVDWENGAILPNYVKATANTRVVGKQVAMILKGLVDNNALSLRTTHLIGFSLGAHVAGFAGAELGNLSRITGLDPAGPLFESQDPRARLDQTDAEFVDVIHSNGENLILGGLGSYQPMGHVDFYPNGGRMQKGCSNIFVGAVSDIIWSSAVEGRSLCNHRRAYKFFTDSVSPRCHFPAFPCDTYEDFLAGKCFPCSEERKCGNMGYYADRSKGKGQLYLITRDEEPFCAHQYHVKIESSPSQIPIVSYGKIQITLIGDSTLNETFTMTRKDDDEMKLGQSISRILVPHPVLSEPTKIQILYSAYSGWLSSGLAQWKIDKVTLSDSFGKSSSVCKKNLILESGVPVTLPLYPGDCNLPKDPLVYKEAQDRVQDISVSDPLNYTVLKNSAQKFIPTPVVHIGNEDIKNKYNSTDSDSLLIKDAIEIFNIPWQNGKENKLEEAESSRAFNTRVIKVGEVDKNSSEPQEVIREVVEPVLRPHSAKNARSHDLNKEKPEITEPILGPTTSRSRKQNTNFKHETTKNDIISKLTQNDKEIQYNFYDLENENDWTPSVNPEAAKTEKWKRQDESSKVFAFDHQKAPPAQENGFNLIAMTVQILPQRLARMFEQAERYARETILPLVSTYTPKFISDFIAPTPTPPKPKYVPLKYEETTARTEKSYNLTATKESDLKAKNKEPPTSTSTTSTTSTTTSTTTETTPIAVTAITTPYTHIQKISRKKEKLTIVYPIPTDLTAEMSENVEREFGRSANHVNTPVAQSLIGKPSTTTDPSKETTGIYIDLPVFEENDVKYIPVSSYVDNSN